MFTTVQTTEFNKVYLISSRHLEDREHDLYFCAFIYRILLKFSFKHQQFIWIPFPPLSITFNPCTQSGLQANILEHTSRSKLTTPTAREMPAKFDLKHSMLCVTWSRFDLKMAWPFLLPSLLVNTSISPQVPFSVSTGDSLSFNLFKNSWKSCEASKFPLYERKSSNITFN